MIITHYGAQFFKLQFGDFTIALNPISKKSKYPQSRFGADVALISLNHPDFNGIENLSHGDRVPFVIDGPGEYEIKGIAIRAFASESQYGGEKRLNTIYYLTLDGIGICFLGALSNPALGEEILEGMQEVHILFVPVGGGGALTPADAHKASLLFEPKLIIPMQYDSATLKKFIDEAGEKNVTPEEKLTVKQKDLEGKEGEIFVLKPAN